MLIYGIYFILWPFFAFVPRVRFIWKYHIKGQRRALERLGHPSVARPNAPVACFYTASLGEAMSMLAFVEAFHLRHPSYAILMLTHTSTAARLVRERLPFALHQYAPWDSIIWTRRFLRYWRPAVWFQVDSDLFPNFLIWSSRSIPLKVYLNARISSSSFAFWCLLPRFFSLMLNSFHLIFAQSVDDQRRLQHFIAKQVHYFGNLKHSNNPVPDSHVLDPLRAHLAGRLVLVYASTHVGEESMAMAIHRTLHAAHPNLLTILIPRYPERSMTLMKNFRMGYPDLRVQLKSLSPEIDALTDVYLVDVIGILNLFYAVADIVFVGRSLSSIKKGGQNIWEPAFFGVPVLFGPNTHNFRSLGNQLILAGGGQRVYDANDLQYTLAHLLTHPEVRARMGACAYAFAHKQIQPLDKVIDRLSPYLNGQHAESP